MQIFYNKIAKKQSLVCYAVCLCLPVLALCNFTSASHEKCTMLYDTLITPSFQLAIKNWLSVLTADIKVELKGP